MALIMLIILISSALVFSSILSKQLTTAQEIDSSERAFYAANSGLEKALYGLTKLKVEEADIKGPGQIEYESGQTADFLIERASLTSQNGQEVPCVVATGTFRQEVRRVAMGLCPS